MTAGKLPITIEQGATFSLALTVDDDGTPRDLTGNTARMKIKETVSDADALLSLTTENGRIVLGNQITTPGSLSLLISAADTAGTWFDAFEGGVYDLEIVDGSAVERLLEGRVKFKKEVTD